VSALRLPFQVRWLKLLMQSELEAPLPETATSEERRARTLRTQSGKLVGSVLGAHMNRYGRCHPSKATIARCAAVSERTADRAIVLLESAGLVHVDRSNGRVCNVYTGLLNGVTSAGVGPTPTGAESHSNTVTSAGVA